MIATCKNYLYTFFITGVERGQKKGVQKMHHLVVPEVRVRPNHRDCDHLDRSHLLNPTPPLNSPGQTRRELTCLRSYVAYLTFECSCLSCFRKGKNETVEGEASKEEEASKETKDGDDEEKVKAENAEKQAEDEGKKEKSKSPRRSSR